MRHALIVVLLSTCAAVAARGVPSGPGLRPPENLAAWYSGRYVQLVWDREIGARIAGYAVYRSAEAAHGWEKLTKKPFPSVSYIDDAPPVGRVRYWVKSVDSLGVESAEGYVVEVTVAPSAAAPKPSASFDRNNIITDGQLLDLSTMAGLENIQDFLDAEGSVLATYTTTDRYDGDTTKTAAQIIFDACKQYGVNPQVVLTTLQKEKGLIKHDPNNPPNPENLAMGWNEMVDSTKGFAAQVYKGTRQFRLYYDRFTTAPGSYSDTNGKPWAVAETMAVFDGIVIPQNKATAGLYIYTPWIGEGGGGKPGIGGNYLFWDLWCNSFHFGPALIAPAAPKTLSPGSPDETQIATVATTTPTLKWEPVSGAQLYEIYVSKEPYGSDNIVYRNLFVSGVDSSLVVPDGKLEPGGAYRWNMVAANLAGSSGFSQRRYFRVELPTAVAARAELRAYALYQNFPNPFNAVTSIRFTLPTPGDAKITIFNLSGQQVAVLADGYFAAGTHQVSWRADSAGSGIYFYRLEAGKFSRTKRLTLAR